MTPIEKAGRKLCRENEITECHWEIWRNTATEQLCAEVFHGREVRRMASNLARKLTPGERAIAEKYGWRE